MSVRSWCLPLLVLAGCATEVAPDRRIEDPELFRRVRAIADELGPRARVAVWLSRAGEPPILAWNAAMPIPCASSIKAAYLVELFASRSGGLDEPLPDAERLLADEHPAVAHFTPEQRATARQELARASVRRIGEVMIDGSGVDNATYNIAANLVTAWCGGPAWLDERLRARDPEWAGLDVRRYMLADRRKYQDNEITASALADVYEDIARTEVPRISAPTLEAVREVLANGTSADGWLQFGKDGALDSDPVTRVRAGYVARPDGPLVHVVALAQHSVPAAERAAAGVRLAAAAERIEQLLLDRPIRPLAPDEQD